MSYTIVNSPYEQLNGKAFEMEGDTEKVWGIEDVWMSAESLAIPAIANYIMKEPPMVGKAYYGKVLGYGIVLHESWLRKD